MSAKRALVVSSGMAALDVISRLLKPGDEVIAGDDLYGGARLPGFRGANLRHQSTTKVLIDTQWHNSSSCRHNECRCSTSLSK